MGKPGDLRLGRRNAGGAPARRRANGIRAPLRRAVARLFVPDPLFARKQAGMERDSGLFTGGRRKLNRATTIEKSQNKKRLCNAKAPFCQAPIVHSFFALTSCINSLTTSVIAPPSATINPANTIVYMTAKTSTVIYRY